MSGFIPGQSTNTDITAWDDAELAAEIARRQGLIASGKGVRMWNESALKRFLAEQARRADRFNIFKEDHAPPSIDLPTLDKAGQQAGQQQRKRAKKYSMLVEGQPANAAANAVPNVGRRKTLGGF
jgi:hypothetical protein